MFDWLKSVFQFQAPEPAGPLKEGTHPFLPLERGDGGCNPSVVEESRFFASPSLPEAGQGFGSE